MSTEKQSRAQMMEQLDLTMRKVGGFCGLFGHAVADRMQMNARDLDCLDFLNTDGPMSAGRLAELTGVTTGAITGIVDRLEKAGLVRRADDPADRRRVIIHPIEEAQEDICKMYGPLQQGIWDICHKFSDEQLEFLLSFYRDIEPMVQQELTKIRQR